MGFFAALFGGRAGICSSASGACSVVVAALCASRECIILVYLLRCIVFLVQYMHSSSCSVSLPVFKMEVVTWQDAPPSQV